MAADCGSLPTIVSWSHYRSHINTRQATIISKACWLVWQHHQTCSLESGSVSSCRLGGRPRPGSHLAYKHCTENSPHTHTSTNDQTQQDIHFHFRVFPNQEPQCQVKTTCLHHSCKNSSRCFCFRAAQREITDAKPTFDKISWLRLPGLNNLFYVSKTSLNCSLLQRLPKLLL